MGDIIADAGALVEVGGGLIVAGVTYLLTSAGNGNDNYPGPLTYTFRPSSEDPINYFSKVDPDNPSGGNGIYNWVLIGGLAYKLYQGVKEFWNDHSVQKPPTVPQYNQGR